MPPIRPRFSSTAVALRALQARNTCTGTAPTISCWRSLTFLSAGIKPEPIGSGNAVASAPTAVVRSSGERDVFWKGTNGRLYEMTYTGFWSNANELQTNGTLESAPSAAVDKRDVVHVFWKSTDGGFVQQMSETGGVWSRAPASEHGTGRVGAGGRGPPRRIARSVLEGNRRIALGKAPRRRREETDGGGHCLTPPQRRVFDGHGHEHVFWRGTDEWLWEITDPDSPRSVSHRIDRSGRDRIGAVRGHPPKPRAGRLLEGDRRLTLGDGLVLGKLAPKACAGFRHARVAARRRAGSVIPHRRHVLTGLIARDPSAGGIRCTSTRPDTGRTGLGIASWGPCAHDSNGRDLAARRDPRRLPHSRCDRGRRHGHRVSRRAAVAQPRGRPQGPVA